MNNDFGSLVMRFTNDFHSWFRHSRKSLANRLTRDPKIVIHGNSCIILYFLNWPIFGIKYQGQEVFVFTFNDHVANRLIDYWSKIWHYLTPCCSNGGSSILWTFAFEINPFKDFEAQVDFINQATILTMTRPELHQRIQRRVPTT